MSCSLHEAKCIPGGVSNIAEIGENVAQPMIGDTVWPGSHHRAEDALHPKRDISCEDNDKPIDNESSQAWDTLLKYMKQHDTNMIDGWRDEMNNLLIFAGLFSAVVTAFTVESYTWLQEDPSEKTANVLQHISLQLSSLTVTQGFVNTTVPPFQASPASPDSSAIVINALWISSLTLSLVAAFFAITVQQWLRRIPVPQYMSTRESVRLRQFRFDGLIRWQVPTIVALLPVLLQIAVLIFLGGLFELLRSIDRTVTTVFAVVAGTSFSIFTISAVMPLARADCPYKSPLVPTAMAILQWCALPVIVPLLLVALILIASIVLAIELLWNVLNYNFEMPAANLRMRLMAWWNLTMDRLERWWHRRRKSLTVFRSANSDLFWTARELHAMRHIATEVECEAFSSAPTAVPQHHLPGILPCLQDIAASDHIRCALRWASVDIDRSVLDVSLYSAFRSPIYLNVLTHTEQALTVQHRLMLRNALRANWTCLDWSRDDALISSVLVVLHRSIKYSFGDGPGRCSSDLVWFTKLLISIRDEQDHKDIVQLRYGRYPTILLFECFTEGGYDLDESEVAHAILWTSSFLTDKIFGAPRRFESPNISELEVILSASATALFAAAQHPSVLRDSALRFRFQMLLFILGQKIAFYARYIQVLGTPHGTEIPVYHIPKHRSTLRKWCNSDDERVLLDISSQPPS